MRHFLRYIFFGIFLPIRLIYFAFLTGFSFLAKGEALLIVLPEIFSSRRPGLLLRILGKGEEHPEFVSYLFFLEKIIHSKHVKDLYIIIPEISFGWVETGELADVFQKIKKSGKTITAFCESGNLKTLFLLSYADFRYMPENSEIHLQLPSVEAYFLRGLFDKVGVRVKSYKSGRYKSFAEMFERNSFSKEAKENLEELLTGLNATIFDDLKKSLKLREKKLYMPVLSSSQLKEEGFLMGYTNRYNFLEFYNYDNFQDPLHTNPSNAIPVYSTNSESQVRREEKLRSFKIIPSAKAKISILTMNGKIEMGESSEATDGEKITARDLYSQTSELIQNQRIEGILLLIDSPGGSAQASELIYQYITLVSKYKKVYAYLMNTAASGGYYIACASPKIFTSRYSITGSIGAVLVRPDLFNLYKKIGVTKERVGFYDYRDILSEYGQLSPQSEKWLQSEIDRIATQFYDRVATARNISMPEVKKSGEGRVFTGSDFRKRKLADGCISLLECINQIEKDFPEKKVKFLFPKHAGGFSLTSILSKYFPKLTIQFQIFPTDITMRLANKNKIEPRLESKILDFLRR